MAAGVRAQFGNIAAIEGLRGVAVLWVVLFHFLVVREVKLSDPWIDLIRSTRPLHTIIGNGYLGVDLFFLITGFLLTLPWWRSALQGVAPPSAREFYRRRVLRIVPAYYVQLVVMFGLVLPLLMGWDYFRRDVNFVSFNIAAHLTFLHYTTPASSASMTVNGALWTLTLEAEYYLLLPLLAPLFVRAPVRSALALLAATAAWRWAALHDLASLVALETWISLGRASEQVVRHLLTTQLPGYLAHFAAGILLGRAWLEWHEKPASRNETVGWLAVTAASLAVLYWGYAGGNAQLGEWVWLATLITLALPVLALVSRGLPIAQPLLANPPLKFIGRISYSMYLYHLPLLLLFNRFLPSENWSSLPLYFSALTLVAWASYRLVERPFISEELRPETRRAPRNTEDTESHPV